MSASSRLLALKVFLIAFPCVALLAAMHYLLPKAKDRLDLAKIEGAKKIETANFVIVTRIDPAYAASLASAFQGFYDALRQDFGEAFGIRALPRRGVTLFLFRTHDEVRRFYIKEFGEKVLGETFRYNGGYYDPVGRTIAIYSRTRSTGRLPSRSVMLGRDLRSIYHEGTHMVFDLSHGGRFSPWIGEGLPSYFETFTKRGGRRVWGVRDEGSFDAVKLRLGGTGDPLATLAVILAADRVAFSSAGNEFYYAGSYALVHFLIDGAGRAYRRAFLDLFHGEKLRGPVPASMRARHFFHGVCPGKEREFAQRWLAHVSSS